MSLFEEQLGRKRQKYRLRYLRISFPHIPESPVIDMKSNTKEWVPAYFYSNYPIPKFRYRPHSIPHMFVHHPWQKHSRSNEPENDRLGSVVQSTLKLTIQ